MPDCPHGSSVDKLITDIYYGDGKDNPSVMTRLDRVERIAEMLDKIWWLLLLAIVSPVANTLISKIWK